VVFHRPRQPAPLRWVRRHESRGCGTVLSGVALVGRLSNVTDARYSVATTFNPFVPVDQQDRYTPGPPRTLYLGLQYGWAR
jgi:hypothetical protein